MNMKLERKPEHMLLLMSFIMPFTFSVWQVMLNNYTVEVASFTGKEIGMLQSVREVPGFLAFASVFLLMWFKEQTLAFFFLALMCIGVGATGFFTGAAGLYFITFVMSVGFHYFETMNQSLTLQWIDKAHTPAFMGKMLAFTGFGSILSYSSVWLLMTIFNLEFKVVYIIAGTAGLMLVLFNSLYFPRFPEKEEQRKKMVLRKKYWLYYLLTFFSGARRQIFMVFAGFMMVEKFGYTVKEISLLYLSNYIFNMIFAPKIGKLITLVGERKILLVEYIGLICIFTSYAFVTNKHVAAGLYIADHLFFAMAIAVKTYFQKIADPKDIAATAGISFTINHIAAVVIPAALGVVWLSSPKTVFMIGAGIACCSLFFSRLINIEKQVYNAPSPAH